MLPVSGTLGSSGPRNTGGMGCSRMLFSKYMVPDVCQGFWPGLMMLVVLGTAFTLTVRRSLHTRLAVPTSYRLATDS